MKNKKKNLQHPRKEEYEEGLFSNRFKGFVSSHRAFQHERSTDINQRNREERRGKVREIEERKGRVNKGANRKPGRRSEGIRRDREAKVKSSQGQVKSGQVWINRQDRTG
jgi:hypothetical protein